MVTQLFKKVKIFTFWIFLSLNFFYLNKLQKMHTNLRYFFLLPLYEFVPKICVFFSRKYKQKQINSDQGKQIFNIPAQHKRKHKPSCSCNGTATTTTTNSHHTCELSNEWTNERTVAHADWVVYPRRVQSFPSCKTVTSIVWRSATVQRKEI